MRWGFAILCTLGIFAMTWLPSPSGPPMFDGIDKVVHVGSFFVLTLAWRWAGLDARLMLALGVVLAAVTEYGQGLLPWPRSPEFFDVLADVAGVVLGVAMWPMARWIRERKTPPG